LEFVERKFGAKDKFTWFEKGYVNGTKTQELYLLLKGKLPSNDGTANICWNFAKFLIDHEGTPFKRYGPKMNPEDLGPDIKQFLKKDGGCSKGLIWGHFDVVVWCFID
jgi:glutathione peroxidase